MKKEYAKVAIVTRTKNRGLLLDRALSSVAAQSYTDFIHVIVNDGGESEEVDSIVNRYNHRTLVVHNKTSVGITAALNQGICAVDSEYITILDDDDTWHNDRLTITLSRLDEIGASVAVVKMDIVEERTEGAHIKKLRQYLHPQSGEGEISLYKQCRRNYLSNGVVMYSRGLYEKLGGYDETLPTAEDWDFGIRLMLKTDVYFVRDTESLVFYHQRPSDTSETGNSGIAQVEIQERAINTVRNRYLRKDIEQGYLGVGYMMNSLEANDESVVRLEAHVNHVRDEIVVAISGELRKRSIPHVIKQKIRSFLAKS